MGVGDETDQHVVVDGAQEMADQRRLAGADFAGENDIARLLREAVLEHVHGHGVRPSRVEKARVGQEREGLLVQAEMRFVHCGSPRRRERSPQR